MIERAIAIDKRYIEECEYTGEDCGDTKNELMLYETILSLPQAERNFILFDLYTEGNVLEKSKKFGIEYSSYRVYACEIKKHIKEKILNRL